MKAPVKKLLFPVLITAGSLITVFYFSCNRDLCKAVACANGGICSNGACTCPAGYEGTNCETASRDKFIGNWQVFEKGSTTTSEQYAVTIGPSNNITDVVITNFYNYFTEEQVSAYVTNDSIYIPNQQYQGYVIVGKGYISSNATYGQYGTITMYYEVVDTANGVIDDFGIYPADLSRPSSWNK